MKYISYFFQKIGFDVPICMKCQILFPGKNKENVIICCLLNFPFITCKVLFRLPDKKDFQKIIFDIFVWMVSVLTRCVHSAILYVCCNNPKYWDTVIPYYTSRAVGIPWYA